MSEDVARRLAQLDSPVAQLLCRRIVSATADGNVTLEFEAALAFCNENGAVQGGLVAAMLDATLGNAVKATLSPGQWPATLELSTRFLRPAQMGRLIGTGQVTHRSRTLAVAQADLRDQDGQLLAQAASTKLIKDRRPGAPAGEGNLARPDATP
ncbi:PaaI family thioesterase [Phenylobacterium sp. SCN 70-31]|uniref:PaaI family thioesterase n=1 Tax=Phenylobacterium sp. SCN 70-31 TaxID=1660129 RepID=UPI0008693E75|nr:PaaI family thioesterase [Phenylobacterium sp. SCN 70-31]ODT88378.1 MAG: hypothetical protein ABS78_07105 [Phenylobacterium sp. SCN 70-31]